MATGKKIKIEQIASGAHRGKAQIATLKALGLGRVRKVVEVVDTPAARGMVKKVAHLVRVMEN